MFENLYNNYEQHLGFTDFREKVILDIGADVGTTAEYFFSKGAKKVYAVDIKFPKSVKEHLKKFFTKEVELIELEIRGADDFTWLLATFGEKVDIVKIDIEGREIHLAYVPSEIFRIVSEYIIECHSLNIKKLLIEKLEKNGYKHEVIKEAIFAKA